MQVIAYFLLLVLNVRWMGANVDQRANPRIQAKIPVLVEGRDIYHKPIREETHTVLVNEAGALVALAAELELENHLRITNQLTGNAAQCRIAFRSAELIQGLRSYGIALLGGPDDFWGLTKQA